jgi:triacylglycerol lipase
MVRAWSALVHDAVDATTHLVSEGHESAARAVLRVTDAFPPIAGPARLIDGVRRAYTGGVLGSVRVVNRAVQLLTDAGLRVMVPASLEPTPIALRSNLTGTGPWIEDAAVGLVNGVFGDRFSPEAASLDLRMRLRHRDIYLPEQPEPRSDRPSVVVLIHGLATTEWCWCLDAASYHGDTATTFGSLLERDLALEPVYVRYNTGRSVATSGAALAARLEALSVAWNPERIVLLGHSMGGLVARSACYAARGAGHGWPARVSDIVSLATPHQGSPLAMAADVTARALGAVDLPTTRILAQILEARSAGIRDLQEGTIRTSHDVEPESLLPHVRYTFLSATLTGDPRFASLAGDLLVPVVSASGPRGAHTALPIVNRTFGGVLHHQIQCHPEVYAVVRDGVGGA